MAENKTRASTSSSAAYVSAIADEARRNDCAALAALMSRVTRQSPVMWGAAIVGFGVHKYALAGGKTGEICAVGFSSRKSDIAIYGVSRAKGAEQLLSKLGKHKLGNGCLYIRRLADVDVNVLGKLIVNAFNVKQA